MVGGVSVYSFGLYSYASNPTRGAHPVEQWLRHLKLNNRGMPNILWKGIVFLDVLVVQVIATSFFFFFFFALGGPTKQQVQ